jgi:hypothetical protein
MKFLMNTKSKIRLTAALMVVPALGGSGLVNELSRPALAQEGGVVSGLTGARLSGGAKRLGSASLARSAAEPLNQLAAEMKLAPGTGPAEIYLWSGYKSGRGGFLKSAASDALVAAGYKIEDIPDERIRTPNLFEEQFGLTAGPVEVDIFDKMLHFTATNVAKGRTVAGIWIVGPERLVLLMTEVGFNAPPKPTVLPTVGGANVILVKDNNDGMRGQPLQKPPAFPKMARRAGFVTGMVRDMNGKPIAGAQIAAQSSAAGGLRTSVKAKTNAQGVYSVALPIGVCQVVNADCRVNYGGKSYLLPLHPVDGDRNYFNSRDGNVENFTLRTYGPATSDVAQNPSFSSSYYGGHVRIQWFSFDITPGGIFEVTLKPQGPLLGGGTGKTMIFRFPNKDGGERYLNDIPIGRYSLSVKLRDGDDVMPVRVKQIWTDAEPTTSVDVLFPNTATGMASLGSSGVGRFEVIMKP